MKTPDGEKTHRPAIHERGDPGPSGSDSPWPGGVAPPLADVTDPRSTPAFRAVGFNLSTIGYAVSRRFRDLLAPLQLGPREFALLRAVGASEGESQQAIGDRLGIPPSRMVAFVDGLEARGLLERRLNPEDRRTRALHLTDAGGDLLGQAFEVAVAHERDLCAGLSDAEREQLLDLLQRVGARLGLAPGRAFGPQGEGWVRWCFASDRARLEDGLSRLRRFVDSHGTGAAA